MAPIPADSDEWEGFGVNSTPSTDNTSLQNGADEEDSSDPFKTWIYAPLIVFMIIALVIVAMQFRRRRRKNTNNLMLRQALARDIEALNNDPNHPSAQRIYIIRTGANGQPEEVVPAGGRRARTGGLGLRPSRWQWSLPIRRAPEEGLNELGEAPPPYDASKNTAVPLQEIRRHSETLTRISEEEQRDASTNQPTESATDTRTSATSTANSSTSPPSITEIHNDHRESAVEPSAPPPAKYYESIHGLVEILRIPQLILDVRMDDHQMARPSAPRRNASKSGWSGRLCPS
ncbi:hypothetical protein MKZ38_002949 [Zalerion maritima]|uniref:Uncharacterized protein n=1 Tax=Zalerion maritima TaxID=339359 RepID=A0AAD5RPD0_9PEZI|nr:hypothetical protein MKZ38_002949 [Zalerion maritima]